jgi:hypothetical protein
MAAASAVAIRLVAHHTDRAVAVHTAAIPLVVDRSAAAGHSAADLQVEVRWAVWLVASSVVCWVVFSGDPEAATLKADPTRVGPTREDLTAEAPIKVGHTRGGLTVAVAAWGSAKKSLLALSS